MKKFKKRSENTSQNHYRKGIEIFGLKKTQRYLKKNKK